MAKKVSLLEDIFIAMSTFSKQLLKYLKCKIEMCKMSFVQFNCLYIHKKMYKWKITP